MQRIVLAIDAAILAIETAGSGCSAAIARGGAVLAAERRTLRHGHAEALLPMIERVMQEAGLVPSQLDAVAAAIGPGGFTGIRVGVAAAHGIALAVGARLIGISSFAAVAARVADRRIADAGVKHPDVVAVGRAGCLGSEDPALLVALDSRRADLYVQLFALDTASPLAAPQALPADRLADYVASLGPRFPADLTLLIAGDAAEAAAAVLGGQTGIAIASDSAPDAEGVLAAALRELRSNTPAGAPTETLAGPVRPLYLRPPDVTPASRPLRQSIAGRAARTEPSRRIPAASS